VNEADRLQPFVPGLVVDWLRETPGLSHRQMAGTLAFVDISGFTALTERLAAKGKIGAEEMSDLLDLTFAALLGVAYEYGGWLVKWAGDAVLLLFEGDDDAERACAAADEMRRTLRTVGRLHTSVGEIRLRMSVGLHSGKFDFYLVGSRHRELIIAGSDASLAVAMETVADAGQIVVSPATAAHLRGHDAVAEKGAGFLLASRPAVHPVPVTEITGFSRHDLGGADLAACLPEMTRDHLLASAAGAEHRLVTVAFIEFSGIERIRERAGQPAVTSAIEQLICASQEAAARHGVTFWETDVAVGGGRVMLVSGAPRSAGQDEDRMLAVVRDVVDGTTGLDLRAGVNSGRVYAGEFGPPFRRTLSVKGDAVNLAARLTSAAPFGEIYAAHTVVTHSRTTYGTKPLPPLLVKGKRQPVSAVSVGKALGAELAADRVDLPFHGRDDELATLLSALDRARQSAGQVFELTGERGIGKSRLVAELVALAHGATVAGMACDRYHSATPYAPFRRLLRQLSGINEDADAGVAGRQLLEVVARAAPSQLPWTPLLAEVMDATVSPTEQSQALDPKLRTNHRQQQVARFLCALVPETLLLIVEDAHLSDDASLDLLRYLAAEAADRPWLIVATRLVGATPIFDTGQSCLELSPLRPDAVALVLQLATEDYPLPPHELALLNRRAGGNPLFVHELLGAARDGGTVSGLPDSVEGVVAVQIDRLASQQRQVLRIASVLGVRVDAPVLHAVLALEGIDPRAAQPVAAQFFDRDGGGWRFRHALVRDTAYEGLPFRQRQSLHRAAGRIVEQLAAADPDTVADLLSLHFFYGREYSAAWRYARIAGDRARAVHAQVEAAELYERAVAAARQLDAADLDNTSAVNEALGEVRYKLGEFDRAAAALRKAKSLARDDLRRARICYQLSLVADRAGRLPVALGWLTRARKVIMARADPGAERLLAECAAQYGLIRHWQGRDPAAVAALNEAVALAESAGADDALATALVWLDNCEMTLGLSASGQHAERALAIWRRFGNRPWEEARALNQLGIRAYFEGRWDVAVDLYGQSKDACERAGDRFTAAVESGNMAEVLSDQGHYPQAQELLRDALRVWRAAAAPSFVAFGKSQLGRLSARCGRFEEAFDLLRSARADYVADGEAAEVLESDARIAECLLLQGDFRSALATADAALNTASTIGSLLPQVPLLQRVRGLALAGTDESDDALVVLDASLASARARTARHEIAWTLQAIEHVRVTAGMAPPSPELIAERAALFDQLGIVAVPTFPG
jgi:class 3 adenylate cyclase/tetratricopeptide (TPR) repeat protein